MGGMGGMGDMHATLLEIAHHDVRQGGLCTLHVRIHARGSMVARQHRGTTSNTCTRSSNPDLDCPSSAAAEQTVATQYQASIHITEDNQATAEARMAAV